MNAAAAILGDKGLVRFTLRVILARSAKRKEYGMTSSEREYFNEYMTKYGEQAGRDLMDRWYPNPELTATVVVVDIGPGSTIVIHGNTEFDDKPRFELVTRALAVFIEAMQCMDDTWCVSIGSPGSDHEFQVYSTGEVVGHTGE